MTTTPADQTAALEYAIGDALCKGYGTTYARLLKSDRNELVTEVTRDVGRVLDAVKLVFGSYDSDKHRQFAEHNNNPDGCFCDDCTAYRVEKQA